MLSILVGLGIMIGIILYMLNLSQASSSAIDTIVNTVSAVLQDAFRFIVLLTPLIIALAPMYILREKRTKDIALGFLYGIITLFIMLQLGLVEAVYTYFGVTNAYWLSVFPVESLSSYFFFWLNILHSGYTFYKIDKKILGRLWEWVTRKL